jgi:hypothetical protein
LYNSTARHFSDAVSAAENTLRRASWYNQTYDRAGHITTESGINQTNVMCTEAGKKYEGNKSLIVKLNNTP